MIKNYFAPDVDSGVYCAQLKNRKMGGSSSELAKRYKRLVEQVHPKADSHTTFCNGHRKRHRVNKHIGMPQEKETGPILCRIDNFIVAVGLKEGDSSQKLFRLRVFLPMVIIFVINVLSTLV